MANMGWYSMLGGAILQSLTKRRRIDLRTRCPHCGRPRHFSKAGPCQKRPSASRNGICSKKKIKLM